MSDTTTPSAAEVMGWMAPWVNASGEQVAPPEGLTPDDMLAWTIGRGWVPEYSYDPVNERHTVRVWRVGRTDVFHAPTLHAALEQAVIAVGRAE